MDEARRALRPLERVVVFFGSLILIGLVIQVGYVITGHGSMLGYGDHPVCASVSPWSVDGYQGSGHVRMAGLAEGVTASVDSVSLCRVDPSAREEILDAIDENASFLFDAGLLFLVWRLLRRGRQEGVFIETFARRLSALGLYVVLGAAAVNVAHTWAERELEKSLIPGGSYPDAWHISFTPLLIGLSLITLGRLMAATVPMREELDATI